MCFVYQLFNVLSIKFWVSYKIFGEEEGGYLHGLADPNLMLKLYNVIVHCLYTCFNAIQVSSTQVLVTTSLRAWSFKLANLGYSLSLTSNLVLFELKCMCLNSELIRIFFLSKLFSLQHGSFKFSHKENEEEKTTSSLALLWLKVLNIFFKLVVILWSTIEKSTP